MYNLNAYQVKGGTLCFSKAGLAVGGTTSKVKLLAPNGAGVDFAINGYMYHTADTDDLFLFTGHTQAANTTCLYLMCLSTTGAATVTKGTEILTTEITAGTKFLKWPEPTAGTCPVGGIKLVTTAIFTGATTALGTGNTATYYDFFAVPVTAP